MEARMLCVLASFLGIYAIDETLTPTFPPLLCSKFGLVCTGERPRESRTANPIPTEYTAEMILEQKMGNDSKMEARATLYSYLNSSLSEGVVTYTTADGSYNMPSISYMSAEDKETFIQIGENENGELNCTKKAAKPVGTNCILQYLGVKFVHNHLADAFFCDGEYPGLSSIFYQNIFTGLPLGHVASPGLHNETTVIYTKFEPGTPKDDYRVMPSRVLDICHKKPEAIKARDVSFIASSGNENKLRIGFFSLESYLLPLPVGVIYSSMG